MLLSILCIIYRIINIIFKCSNYQYYNKNKMYKVYKTYYDVMKGNVYN